MFRALTTAATGMAAQEMRISTIANNMANVNTTGYRRARTEFQDMVYQTMRSPGGQTANGTILPSGVMVGSGTKTVATAYMHSQGNMAQTGAPLDMAIEGGGYFQITQPNGQVAFTRAGNFKTDAQGQLVTSDGLPVNPNVSLPADAVSITISPDGVISVMSAGQTQATEAGQIQLATFANPGGLMPLGRNLYAATNASGQPLTATPGQEGTGTITQGFLEGSNVEIVNEMIDLIQSQRAYESNQKVIETADEMLRRATRG